LIKANSNILTIRERFDKNKEKLILLLIALPFIIITFMFNYVPLFGWILSFFDYTPGVPLNQTSFVGLQFFISMFTDQRDDIINVMTNTFVLSFLGILCTPLPVIFAIMLNEVQSTKFKKLVQTTTTLPNFISWIIVFSLAFTMFSSEGFTNTLLINMKIIKEPLSIMANADITWAFQTILSVWKTLGWSAIIYIATMSGIDSEQYEAATIDGAGRLGKILHVTLPGISSTFFVLLLLNISNILSSGGGLEQYFVFYNGPVGAKIEVLDYYIYRIGVVSNFYSYATAIGVLKSLLSIALLFGANTLSKKVRGISII